MVKPILCIFLFFVIGLFAFGQSNTIMDSLLEEEQTTWGSAAYLVLTAARIIPEDSTQADAVEKLESQGWHKEVGAAEESIRLGEYSHMLMKAFEIHGGIMYSLIPGPRYASRELYFKRIIRQHSSPYRTLNGEEAVDILGSLLEWKEVRS